MQGIRRDRPDNSIFESGEYGKISNGEWQCCPPDTNLIGGLSKHEVTEHEDGTITVSPSILIRHWSGKIWHGYLERGIWRKV
jgi:hypothetical protein